jgi:hypothetical protein
MLSREQMEADIEFLALRSRASGSFVIASKRDWGVSSNSIVSFAYGVGDLEMPYDWADYAACVRAARKLPRHRRTKTILIALNLQKEAVTQRYSVKERRTETRKKRETMVNN